MMLQLRDIRLPLAEFDLEIDVVLRSRSTGIMGPSGAGKTSLLNLVAGLVQAQSGLIDLNGTVLLDTRHGTSVPCHQRRVGYVPQDLALFPHLSVLKNITYGRNSTRDGGAARLRHLAEMLEISPLLGRSIGRLSGGEKQRVAFARALFSEPRLLLLDEPLSSLDAALRGRVIEYLQRIGDEFAIPMLYVTHCVEEVEALCDECLVLDKGRVQRQAKAPSAR